MVKVGIDALSFYTPRYQLTLDTLAQGRGVDPDKFILGLGQKSMSIVPPGEDIVTMGASASKYLLQHEDVESIAMVLFATESGIDQSKAAGLYIQELLQLPTSIRILEIKQACYAGTGALQFALPYLRENQDKKILVIASDVARYGLNTPGESSQGAGAVAMLLSAHPRILAIDGEYGVVSESVMDFWRPNYSDVAFVDGKYSSKLYLSMLEKSFRAYEKMSHRTFLDHAHVCYHAPVPRLVEKAHQHLFKLTQQTALSDLDCQAQMHDALYYNRQMGNSYTASLYVSLLSLLDRTNHDLSHARIGFYSYGSGCVAEFFSGIVQPGYQQMLHQAHHQTLLEKRQVLSYPDYETYFNFAYNEQGETQTIPLHETGDFRLEKLDAHKRYYSKKAHVFANVEKTSKSKTFASPGKLILSGEHAVLYGAPALACAINRYVSATISAEDSDAIHFHLADFSHNSHFSWQTLQELKDKIKLKYRRFMRGDYTIRQVLQKPFELAQVALGLLSERITPPALSGMNVKVESNLPIGCGMGSSAATILSIMQALSHFFGLTITDDALFKAALEAENLQHGHSSGLDLRLALLGGCLYVKDDIIEARPTPNFPFHLIQTGQPQSTTGQCVFAAKPFMQPSLLQQFRLVTEEMDQALQQQSHSKLQQAIKNNHRLLVQVGVVPEKVQAFVKEVEALNGAAKVCGAGAVLGDAAGTLWLVHEQPEQIAPLLKRYQYQEMMVYGVTKGVYAA